MSEPKREHALFDFMQEQAGKRVVAPGVTIGVEPGLSHINLRGRPDDALFTEGLRNVIHLTPPSACRVDRVDRVDRGADALYWQGPDEFLLVTSNTDSRGLTHQLNQVWAGTHAAATDVSGGQIRLTVSGPSARVLLSKASTLDLHETVFAVNACAQSTFAKTAALYALRDESPTFELIVRRSFADYAARWLAYAGQEFGLVFEERTIR